MSELLEYMSTSVAARDMTESFNKCRNVCLNGTDDEVVESILYHHSLVNILPNDKFIRLYDRIRVCISDESDLWINRDWNTLLEVMKHHTISSSPIRCVWMTHPSDFPLDEVLDLYRHKVFYWNDGMFRDSSHIILSPPEVWVKFIERGILVNIVASDNNQRETFFESLIEAHKIYREMCDNHRTKSASRD